MMKHFVAVALLLAGCAPEVAAVPTTSANVPNARVEWKPRPEARVDALQVTNAGPAPAKSDVHEAPAEAKARPSGYLVLAAVVLMPFILLPSAKGVAGLYVPSPAFAPAASLPSGELPGTAEIVSTIGPEPIVGVPQVIATPTTIATPQTGTTERSIIGLPLGQWWMR